jgi:hypothetical protein
MIILIPYKSPDLVRQIKNSFENINLQLLNLENATYLNTKQLTQSEKNDRMFDFLGGFELIDSEMRLFVIEGLGGEGRSMNLFYKANER